MAAFRNTTVTPCLPGLDKLIPADICAQQETVQFLIVFGLALAVSMIVYVFVKLYELHNGGNCSD